METGPNGERLDDLLLCWEELREGGRDVSPEQLCADCPELAGALAERVKVLLAMESPLETKTASPESTGPNGAAEPGARRVASCTARFSDLRFHAAGGLGEVFIGLGEDLNREVALKFIKRSRYCDDDDLQRFLREAEVTGRLEHPGVVPVYGLGTDEAGRPCYVMRFVQGETLGHVVAELHQPAHAGTGADRELELRTLLRRFISVCNTVAYAHGRGVLHRDLTPRNIMLGRYDETLVIDWGLARPIGGAESVARDQLVPISSGAGAAAPTAGIIGTPSYMSPEQAEGRHEAIGPASDIYGLGAILYQILTGRAPVTGASVTEILEQVRRGAFPRPCAVNPRVPRALEAVCLKAMALRPEDRYAKAESLALDIERWLGDEPTSAYSEPLTARTWRWMRKHRTAAWAAAVLVITAAIASLVGTVMVDRQKRRAEQNAALARSNFRLARDAVDQMLTRVGEERLAAVPQMEETRRALLEEALAFYERFLRQEGNDPDLRRELARARNRAGVIRKSLGRYEGSEEAFRGVFRLLDRALNQTPADLSLVASAHNNLALLLSDLGRYQEAEREYGSALEMHGRLADRFPAEEVHRKNVEDCRNNLGNLLRRVGRRDEAEALFRRVLDARAARERGPAALSATDRLKLASSHFGLGLFLLDAHRGEEAEREFLEARRVVAPLVAMRGAEPDHRELHVSVEVAIADAHEATGQYAAADRQFRDALQMRRTLAADFPAVPQYRSQVVGTAINRAVALEWRDRYEDALQLLRDTLPEAEALAAQAPSVPSYLALLGTLQNNLGNTLRRVGRRDEANPLLAAARQTREALVHQHPHVATYQYELATTYSNLSFVAQDRGQFGAAEAWVAKAVPLFERLAETTRALPEYQEGLAGCYTRLAIIRSNAGRPADAEGSLRRALLIFDRLVAERPSAPAYRRGRIESRIHLAERLRELRRLSEAEAAYRETLTDFEALGSEAAADPAFRNLQTYALNNLGVLYSELGRWNEAERVHRRVIEIRERLVAEFPGRANYLAVLAASYGNLGHTLSGRGALSEARRILIEQAIPKQKESLQLSPGNADSLRYLANDLVNLAGIQLRLGDHLGARATAEELAQDTGRHGAAVYDAACIITRCAQFARDDQALTEIERARRSRAQFDRAMELLRVAVKAGWNNAAWTERDPDLVPLHGRDDFRRLVASMFDRPFPADPFAN
jgi:serine/threonine-protein kinase